MGGRDLELASAEGYGAALARAPRFFVLLAACGFLAACGTREDPARAELRQRLGGATQLSTEELARFRAEIIRAMDGKTFFREGPGREELKGEEHQFVFEMLTEPAGVFDEGLRRRGETMFRVLNAPAPSSDAEIEAFRKLWIDTNTFLPARFEFAHSSPGYEEYSFDLVAGSK